MENAVKAMYIAAGVLIGILILTLGVTLFASLQSYVEFSQDQIRFNDINSFNAKFTGYINSDDGHSTTFDLVIQDVISAANLAYENNVQLNYDAYSDENDKAQPKPENLYVAVYLDGTRVDGEDNKVIQQLLINNTGKSKYICSSKCENRDGDIVYNENSGRVCKVNFRTQKLE